MDQPNLNKLVITGINAGFAEEKMSL